MKKVLMGNHAVSVGVQLARTEVVSAYPITPQTQSVEMLTEMKAAGEFPGRVIRIESEHSAMASLIGASSTGARSFTSTSSQGLAYMHELLHWASGARLPIVMANVNRGLAAPWVLTTDQTDSLSQRDTGWLQFYSTDNQEVLDSILMAFKISEQILIPSMVVLDGFTLSHTYEPVDVPDQEAVDRFLPKVAREDVLDPARPVQFGALIKAEKYFQLRRRLAADMDRALGVIEQVGREFKEAFGRDYGLFESYRTEDAETVLVTSGAVASTAREAVDELRSEGHRAGNLRFRVFRPFPTAALRQWIRPGIRLAVVDRNYSQGHHGIFCEEIKSALYPMKEPPQVYGFVAGLGGGDITVELLKEMWKEAHEGRADPSGPTWMEDVR